MIRFKRGRIPKSKAWEELVKNRCDGGTPRAIDKLIPISPVNERDLYRIYKPFLKELKVSVTTRQYSDIVNKFWELVWQTVVEKNIIMVVAELGRFMAYKQKNDVFMNLSRHRDFRMLKGKFYDHRNIKKANGYYPSFTWRPSRIGSYGYLKKNYVCLPGMRVRKMLFEKFFEGGHDFNEGFASTPRQIEELLENKFRWEKKRSAEIKKQIESRYERQISELRHLQQVNGGGTPQQVCP